MTPVLLVDFESKTLLPLAGAKSFLDVYTAAAVAWQNAPSCILLPRPVGARAALIEGRPVGPRLTPATERFLRGGEVT